MTAMQTYKPMSGQPTSQATVIEQSRAVAEVQAAVVVAQQCPRDLQGAEAEMRDTCSRMAMAEHAFYQVTNRGTGPSVHLMRELARIWGNTQYGVNELSRNDVKGESEVQAWAWDVEKNTRSTRTFIVPHARMKNGQRVTLTDLSDIYLNNNNIGARAVRECIATILPRWYTETAATICKRTLEHGEGEPLPDRIERMIKGFRELGVTEAQIESRLGKKRRQFNAGDVAQMGITYTSITRDGQALTEYFPVESQVSADEIAAKPKAQKDGAADADYGDLLDAAREAEATA